MAYCNPNWPQRQNTLQRAAQTCPRRRKARFVPPWGSIENMHFCSCRWSRAPFFGGRICVGLRTSIQESRRTRPFFCGRAWRRRGKRTQWRSRANNRHSRVQCNTRKEPPCCLPFLIQIWIRQPGAAVPAPKDRGVGREGYGRRTVNSMDSQTKH